jgi:hypothetical protein
MKIPIPRVLVTAWEAFCDWGNVPAYKFGRFEVRRIDVLLFILGSGIATHYWLFYGWRWAIMGALMYILVVMAAVWVL